MTKKPVRKRNTKAVHIFKNHHHWLEERMRFHKAKHDITYSYAEIVEMELVDEVRNLGKQVNELKHILESNVNETNEKTDKIVAFAEVKYHIVIDKAEAYQYKERF